MKIVFIGAGNLATQLSAEIQKKVFDIIHVYSKTIESASALGNILNCNYTNNLSEINTQADLYIFSVKDSALPEVLPLINIENGIAVHTAGSVSMNIFKPFFKNYGVFYPLQTFSKSRKVDFSNIPFFIEGSDLNVINILKDAASEISDKVYFIDSEQRKQLHLSAVFACNFTNHMYDIASKILKENNIPFEALKPLIRETADKIDVLSPNDAQTGPAVRYDENIIN